MLQTLAKFGRLSRDIQLYIVGWGFVGFGYFGILGVLFNLYLVRLGYGTEDIGLLIGVGQLIWGLSAIPAAWVGDRLGNRQAMILGIWVQLIAIALLISGQWLGDSIRTTWIAIWWFVSWIGAALSLVNGTPFLMAICPLEDRRATFTLQQVAFGFCGFVGSLIAGALPGLFVRLSGRGLDDAMVYWYALWLTPLAYLISLLLWRRTKYLPPMPRQTQSATDVKMPLSIILFVGLLVFLQSSGEGAVRAFFNVYLDTELAISTTSIGLVLGAGQFLPILTSLAAPWFMDRWGTAKTLIFTGVFAALSMGALVIAGGWVVATAGYMGVLLTISVAGVARSLFSQEIVAQQWRTLMNAVFTMGLALGWGAAAGVGGYIIAGFGYGTLFLLGAIMAALAALLVWGYVRMSKAPAAEAPAVTSANS